MLTYFLATEPKYNNSSSQNSNTIFDHLYNPFPYKESDNIYNHFQDNFHWILTTIGVPYHMFGHITS